MEQCGSAPVGALAQHTRCPAARTLNLGWLFLHGDLPCSWPWFFLCKKILCKFFSGNFQGTEPEPREDRMEAEDTVPGYVTVLWEVA